MKLSQTQKLINLLCDYKPHSTVEIQREVYGNEHAGLSRVGARIWDIKALGYEVIGWKDEINKTIYWYQMKRKVEKEMFNERNIDQISKPVQKSMFKSYIY